MATKDRRECLTLRDKIAICQYKYDHPAAERRELIAWAKMNLNKVTSASTIGRVLSKQAEYLQLNPEALDEKRSRLREPKRPKLEEVSGPDL